MAREIDFEEDSEVISPSEDQTTTASCASKHAVVFMSTCLDYFSVLNKIVTSSSLNQSHRKMQRGRKKKVLKPNRLMHNNYRNY